MPITCQLLTNGNNSCLCVSNVNVEICNIVQPDLNWYKPTQPPPPPPDKLFQGFQAQWEAKTLYQGPSKTRDLQPWTKDR